jgi:hypothetical protein
VSGQNPASVDDSILDEDAGIITLQQALAGPYSETTIHELSAADRRKLPASWHRPYFMGLTTPKFWMCTACWSASEYTGWPCETATKGGEELSEALGLECAS